MEHYTWYQWLTFFYLYCFFGWIFESTYVSLRKRCLINRGFTRLPLLALYGFCAIMILWVAEPFRNSLFLVYLLGTLTATQLEYITGSLMEQLFRMKYWDYSDQHFHLHGHICLRSSLAWGFLALLLTEVIHPPIARVVLEISPAVLLLCISVLTPVYLIEFIQATRETLGLRPALEAMEGVEKAGK